MDLLVRLQQVVRGVFLKGSIGWEREYLYDAYFTVPIHHLGTGTTRL